MAVKRKIINDPVYGFITIHQPLIFDIVAHPIYQRLRRIHQMALAFLVYPGAVHTRLHHSLGAYHLMCLAVTELREKGISISEEEEIAVKAGILLHDLGHGPFSHALESQLLQGVHHEDLSLRLMHKMNEDFGGRLDLAIQIFTGQYHRQFLHQLISGQLDVDRMDYLTRDSFFTGVSEGVIGYARIIKMLTVHNDELMVEEKGIYSIEKFLIARRQMYWQVYLHKTVLSAEKMLTTILLRARELGVHNQQELQTGGALDYFLFNFNGTIDDETLEKFCDLDDVDFSFAIKKWSRHPDFVLNKLCNLLLRRKLLKIQLQSDPVEPEVYATKLATAAAALQVDQNTARYFVFCGEANNTLYKVNDERINILFKDGSVKDISAIDDPLIHQTVSAPVKKFYICSLG